MFESAELGHSIDKKTYEAEEPKLRRALLDVQHRVLIAAKFPVVVVIGGVDGGGKGETVNVLTEWMDARHIETHALTPPSDEERERPRMWRFWRELPPKGKLGIFFGSWYTEPIVERARGTLGDNELDRHLEQIVSFEKMLTDEGVLLLKFWFHLSKKAQKTRLQQLESDKRTSFRVTKEDWRNYARYDKFRSVSERALRETSRNAASWLVIEGTDDRYRELTAGRTLLDAMKGRLDAIEAGPAAASSMSHGAHGSHGTHGIARAHPTATKGIDTLPEVAAIDHQRVVDAIDLTKKLESKEYDDLLDKWQRKLNLLSRHSKFKKISVVAAFEGSDAAGKGGTIRRVIWALDARQYRVVPIAAPTQEELAQPYLWRFWRHLPRLGDFAIFDRTWYGRVLVERVEGYAAPEAWMRAYSEINDFEEQMVKHGTVVVKCWLQISKEEQLRRFKERERVKYKNYKIGPDDWRNRKKWNRYAVAMCDMVDRTSTEIAPWTLVSSEDKHWARIKVLETLCKRIEDAF